MSTRLPGATKKEDGVQAEYEQRALDALLRCIARGGRPPEDGHGFGREGTGESPRKAKEGTVIASHSGQPDIEIHLDRIEARLAYVGVSLGYMEVYRTAHIYYTGRLRESRLRVRPPWDAVPARRDFPLPGMRLRGAAPGQPVRCPESRRANRRVLGGRWPHGSTRANDTGRRRYIVKI